MLPATREAEALPEGEGPRREAVSQIVHTPAGMLRLTLLERHGSGQAGSNSLRSGHNLLVGEMCIPQCHSHVPVAEEA